MDVKIDGGKLIITLDIANPAPLSKSGKTYLVASTDGIAKTGLMIQGKPLSIGVNAMIPVVG